MPKFTLRQLEYFLAVLDSGSVTAAARQEHITQPSASMAIAQLESAVGTPLLLRKRSKGVAPTPAGMELALRARHVLSLANEISAAAAGSWSEMRGELRVGCMDSLSPRLIPGIISHFHTAFPAINVTFREGAAAELQQDVMEGALDVALLYSLQAIPGVNIVQIADVRLQLMLPASHPLADRATASFQDMAGEPLILLEIPPTPERVTAMMRAAGVEPKMRWGSSNMETIRSLVARGLGYSVANTHSDSDLKFDGGRVAYVPISDDLPKNSIAGALPPGMVPPRRVEELIRYCRSTAS